MPVEFEGQAPEAPYIFRVRLTCDHCRRQALRVEVPLQTHDILRTDYDQVMDYALRYVEQHGWQWDSPGEGSFQVVTCHVCRGRQRQLQQALADLPGSTLTEQQLIDLSQTMSMGVPTVDFIDRGLQPTDIVPPPPALPRIVTDSSVPEGTIRLVAHDNTILAHPNDEERYRQEVAGMIAQAEGDPDYQVFSRADVEAARSTVEQWPMRPLEPDVFRQELMGVFPEPEGEPADRVRINGGAFVDREGRTWETEPFDVDVPHSAGRREIGIDAGLGDDTTMAQVLIDGVPTGEPIPLRMKVEPLRKSKWERLMEDDDETCP